MNRAIDALCLIGVTVAIVALAAADWWIVLHCAA